MKGVYLFLSLILSFLGCRKNDKNTLIVYTAANFKPYEYEDVNKNIVGIDIDIIREVGKIIKKNIEIQNVNFESLLPGLLINKADIVIAALSATEERAKTVAFSQPYCTTKLGIITRVENKIESCNDIAGKIIGVCSGDTSDLFCTQIQKYDENNIRRFNNVTDSVEALQDGIIDACMVDFDVANTIMNSGDNKQFFMLIPNDLASEQNYVIAVHKDNTELLKKINDAINKLKQEGKIEEIKTKYLTA